MHGRNLWRTANHRIDGKTRLWISTNDDIYSFDQIIPFRFVPLVSGFITLEDSDSKEGITIELLDANENLIASQVTDAKGNYSFDLKDETQYVMRYTKDGYDPLIANAVATIQHLNCEIEEYPASK